MTASEFAKAMEYDYSTVMRWLKKGLVPGAEFQEINDNFGVWNIPKEALTMKPPRAGRKPGTKNGVQTAKKAGTKKRKGK